MGQDNARLLGTPINVGGESSYGLCDKTHLNLN